MIKANINVKDNDWYFENVYNNYFCFCKGLCLYEKLTQECKYLFYLYIIDKNKNLYNKTDYLFADFYFFSSDDTYPIFEKMIKQNINAHYMDEKISIYNKFCSNETKCLKVIPIINGNPNVDGDFLEKYLDLILKLKAVIVGHQIFSLFNIFYNIDYITYINLGHGVKYFKYFSYNNYSSYRKYNKVLLPPSKKIISIAKNYGWNDNDIIKLCLPKWDKYDDYINKLKLNKHYEHQNKSIFIMFTWRNLTNNTYKISPIYIKNIVNLINDNNLNKALIKYNISLYFTLHPNLKFYRKQVKVSKIIKYIKHEEISDCLMKSNLLITDFSSVIFDMIYQAKPYIMFIPDAYDKNIKYIYDIGYYEIITRLKNGSFPFENKYLNIRGTVNKAIFYFQRNFTLEPKLKRFYDSFELKCKNNTNAFINYLIHNI